VCEAVRAALAPLAKQIEALDEAIAVIDKQLERVAKADDKVSRAFRNRSIQVTSVRGPEELRQIEKQRRGEKARHNPYPV